MRRVTFFILVAWALASGIDAKPQELGQWTVTDNLDRQRLGESSTLLASGDVLVVGGSSGFGAWSSYVLFDPIKHVFSETQNMAQARVCHTATLLPDGKVIVAGGIDNSPDDINLSSCELYDQDSDMWTKAADMVHARSSHTATLLQNGKVLVTGGCINLGTSETGYNVELLSSCELYDLATGKWTTTGSMIKARREHTATLLPNGKVLVVAGEDLSDNACELYNPETGTWETTGSIRKARHFPSVSPLQNGDVLMAGGGIESSEGIIPTASCELYCVETGTWMETGSMTLPRMWHTCTLLEDGTALAAGGTDNRGTYTSVFSSCELYDSSSGTWTTAESMTKARYIHSATLLSNGNVFVSGGIVGNYEGGTGCELYMGPRLCRVVFSAWPNGMISGMSTQYITEGSSTAVVTAIPNAGYIFQNWRVNGIELSKKNPLTVDDVTADMTITARFAKAEYWVAYGSVFTVNASDMQDSAPLAKKPKVQAMNLETGKKGGTAKVLGFVKSAETLNCVWQGKDMPGTYELLVNGEVLTEEFTVMNPNDFDVSLSSDTGVAGDEITLRGQYFGSKCPKLTMEFKDAKGKQKKASCKVSKPYAFADANGKAGNSVMDVNSGDSELIFTVPKGITETTTATLKLNCNGTMVEKMFNK